MFNSVEWELAVVELMGTELLGVTSGFLFFVRAGRCGCRLAMTPGNPPIHKTVNSSSAKASLAQ